MSSRSRSWFVFWNTANLHVTLCSVIENEKSFIKAVDVALESDSQVEAFHLRKACCSIFVISRLQEDPPVGVSGAPSENNIMQWNAVIFG